MKKKIMKLLKNKTFVMFLVLFVILLVCLFLLKSAFIPNRGSNYGNRLDGIEKISFKDKDKTKITKSIEENDKVSSCKLVIHGKIINIIYNVNENVGVNEAKEISQSSLDKFSKEVKEFYDIQFIITNNEEKWEEVEITNDDGTKTTEINKNYPVMGYKNSSKDNIVW